MTKQVLFIGDLNFYSKGSSRIVACRSLGYETKTITHTAIGGNEFGFAPQTLIFKIAWRLGIHLDTENVNKMLLSCISRINPDILWIEKGNMIYPKTLKIIKKDLPKTIIISYSDDDMFNRLNRTHAYTKSLNLYDIIFVTKSLNTNYNELPSLGAKQVIAVDKAFDPNQHYPIKITKEEKQDLGSEVSFIGTFAPERAQLLNYLAANKIKVKIWGNGLAKRELMYVNDLSEACEFFLKKRTRHTLINIGSGDEKTITAYAKFICKKLGIKLKFDYDRTKPTGTPRKKLNLQL